MNKLRNLKKETIAEILFVLFAFVFYLMWARIQPLNSSPDEGMRYQIAQYIYEHGSLPVGDDPAVRDPVWGISYAFNPILDYMAAAVFMKLMSLVTTSPFALLFAARLVSVLCGAGTAYMALKIGKKLFDRRKAWLFAIFIAFLPGAVFVTSYVNSDSMAILSTAIIVYAWICGSESGWNLKDCTMLSVGIGLCALAYYNAYGFILCSILFFGSTLLITCQKQGDYKLFVKRGAYVCILVLVLISWWFIRSYILYDGDILGRNASSICAEKYAQAGLKPSQRELPSTSGMSFFEMLCNGFAGITISWVELVSRSFVGRFGSIDICMPTWIENNYMDFIKFGVLLVFIHPIQTFALKKDETWNKKGIFNWCMLAAMIIPNVLNAWYSYTSDYQPQGRYSLPMLIPLTYFIVMGYGNLFDSLIKNEKARTGVYAFLGAALIALSIYAYIGVFWPCYMSEPFGLKALITGN